MDTIRAASKADRVVTNIAQFLGVAEDAVVRERTIRDINPNHDSLDDVELVMDLEDAFGIDIDDVSAERLSTGTVQSYIDYIESREDAK